MIIGKSIADCNDFSVVACKKLYNREKIPFPAMPPIIAPSAIGTVYFHSSSIFSFLENKIDVIENNVIDSTVTLLAKLPSATGITLKTSIVGLIMMPPPIPHILPITDERNATEKTNHILLVPFI